VIGADALAILNLAPIPFGLVPAQQYGLKPNYYLPRGLGLPEIIPGAKEQNEEDRRRRMADTANVFATDREIAYAAARNFSPQRLQELINQTESGSNPLKFAERTVGLRHLKIEQAKVAQQDAAAQQQQPNNTQPQPEIWQWADRPLRKELAVAAAAGDFVGLLIGLTPRQASFIGDALIHEQFRRERAQTRELPENSSSFPLIVQQAFIFTDIAGLIAGLPPQTAEAISTIIGSHVLFSLTPEELAADAARKKKAAQPPVQSPGSPGAPPEPGTPPSKPVEGSGGTPGTPVAPGMGPSEYDLKYPVVPPSAPFPDHFFSFKKNDP
jgi:hypothetical protein